MRDGVFPFPPKARRCRNLSFKSILTRVLMLHDGQSHASGGGGSVGVLRHKMFGAD